jgi:protein TonB
LNASLAIYAGDSAARQPRAPQYGARPSRSRRAGSFLLAIAIEILLLLAFFTINFRERKAPEFEGGRLSTFDLSAESQQDRSATPQKEAEQVAEVKPPRPVPPIPKPAVTLPDRPLDMIVVTKEVFEASDIAKLGSNAPGFERSAKNSAGAGRAAGDSQRVGTAPNGEPLYAAEWYREPTHTELNAYLPKRLPEGGGWGMVACKTAERFRVTDCVELGQQPAGSHLAGAVRQAAWQFLVRPPRVGGKPLVGEWVRIRITYETGPASRE